MQEFQKTKTETQRQLRRTLTKQMRRIWQNRLQFHPTKECKTKVN
jgi:hypothetical protein